MEEANKKAVEPEKEESFEKSVLLCLHDLVHTLAVVMLVLMLLFRMVIVSGSSMYNTLVDGDWLLLLSSTFYTQPEYGDIVVACKESFRGGEPIVKRVIATEGQTVDIDFERGIVYVDGVALEEDYIYSPTTNSQGMQFPLTVDSGCIFVMGDNRRGSMDSRHPTIGLVDTREILGKALFLFLPGTNEGLDERDFDRIGALN